MSAWCSSKACRCRCPAALVWSASRFAPSIYRSCSCFCSSLSSVLECLSDYSRSGDAAPTWPVCPLGYGVLPRVRPLGESSSSPSPSECSPLRSWSMLVSWLCFVLISLSRDVNVSTCTCVVCISSSTELSYVRALVVCSCLVKLEASCALANRMRWMVSSTS